MAKTPDRETPEAAGDSFARLSGMPTAYFEAQRALYPAGDHGALRLFLALRAAARRVDTVAAAWLHRFDLTPTKLDVLHLLAAGGDAGTTISALRDSLRMTQPNVTYVVNSLQRQKLIRRKIDRDDRRTSIITISPLGLDLVERQTPIHLASIARALAGIDASDRERIIATLAEVVDGFERDAARIDR